MNTGKAIVFLIAVLVCSGLLLGAVFRMTEELIELRSINDQLEAANHQLVNENANLTAQVEELEGKVAILETELAMQEEVNAEDDETIALMQEMISDLQSKQAASLFCIDTPQEEDKPAEFQAVPISIGVFILIVGSGFSLLRKKSS